MKIKFWKVGTADAITINYKDNDGFSRNVFIDGGYLATYRRTIKKELMEIQSKDQQVNLWVITHTDRDHIGGVEAFLKDPTIKNKESLVSEYWFNWSSYEFTPLDQKISLQQGIKLRDYLFRTGKLRSTDIVESNTSIELQGLRITILSPDKERLDRSKVVWNQIEQEKLITGEFNDYNQNIEPLLKQTFREDVDVWNGGSIAFLLKYIDFKILFLADSYPSVVIQCLKNMGYSSTNRLHVDYMKLSHHGSKRNFNPEIMEIVDCNRFIILANGITHSLPSKWTLAQILGSPYRNKEKIQFYFNDDTETLRSMFKETTDEERYNFECIYNDLPFLTIEPK